MTVYYVDFSGSAGSGNGTSFANRASSIKNISNNSLTAGTDEIRCKGNPVTSVGTAKIPTTTRNYPSYGTLTLYGQDIVYSTTAGQTYFTKKGFETGDRVFVCKDDNASALSQPSLVGFYTVTINNSYPSRVYLDGYTANSNATGSGYSSTRVATFASDVIEMNTSNLTREIASMDFGRSAWAGVSGVTTSLDSDFTSNNFSTSVDCLFTPSDKISVPSSQSVGKIAHYQLPSTLDLSGYQQISFMVKASVSSFSTADSIRLCTDTAGDTSVHTAPIQLRNASSNDWIASVTDLGANMNSSIKSIAIYREATQSSSCDYRFQNIIACKDSSAADAITHQSLIGLNATIPIWYNIALIKGDLVFVKCMDNYRGNKSSYYSGGYGAKWTTTGNSAAIYKVEPFFTVGATSDTADEDSLQNYISGNYTDNNFMTISGGWNATDMTSKAGVTIIQGNGRGKISFQSKAKLELKDLFWHNYHEFYWYSNYQPKITDCGFSHFNKSGSQYWNNNKAIKGLKLNYVTGLRDEISLDDVSQASSTTAADFNFNYCGMVPYFYITYADPGSSYNGRKNWLMNNFNSSPSRAYDLSLYTFEEVEINLVKQSGNVYFGVTLYQTKKATIQSVEVAGKFSPSLYTADLTIGSFTHAIPLDPANPTTVTGSIMGYQMYSEALQVAAAGAKLFINSGSLMGEVDTDIANGMKLNGLTKTGAGSVRDSESTGPLFWRNYNNTSGDNRSYYSGHLVTHDSTIVHTANGKSMKAQVLSTSASSGNIPLGSIMVNASSAVTISLYVYITGSNEQVTLSADSAPWMGLAAAQAVIADTSSGTSQNTWTQITKTFTPTSAGKINISVGFSQNSTSSVMYVDDFGVSQA